MNNKWEQSLTSVDGFISWEVTKAYKVKGKYHIIPLIVILSPHEKERFTRSVYLNNLHAKIEQKKNKCNVSVAPRPEFNGKIQKKGKTYFFPLISAHSPLSFWCKSSVDTFTKSFFKTVNQFLEDTIEYGNKNNVN
ncbi:hypothetical protein [Jeotgalibacillus soli]|uniref:Uncharacterized protein n=1 Tax=Jeotgalibacillus soli TaxID=889306 RepID=A0A0C2R5B8_9BACL|nr:hypothetical protein [Jeotgalibacillus soli]KIL45450.1 hypothetical protein KP78_29940 [Jeotgalibacillus soli]